jgi:hypothetical protein
MKTSPAAAGTQVPKSIPDNVKDFSKFVPHDRNSLRHGKAIQIMCCACEESGQTIICTVAFGFSMRYSK